MPPVLSLVVGRALLPSFRHFPPPHRALSSFHRRYERTLHLPLSSSTSSSPTSSSPLPPFSLTPMVGMSSSTSNLSPSSPQKKTSPRSLRPSRTRKAPQPPSPPSPSSSIQPADITEDDIPEVSLPASWNRPPSDELKKLLSTLGLGNITGLPPMRSDWNEPWRPWRGEKPSAEEVAELRKYATDVYDGGAVRLDNNNNNHNQSVRTFPFLGSISNSLAICGALDSAAGGGGTIEGVPVDDRKAGRTVFDDWVNKTDPVSRRRAVLCNAAFAGSGKTVQLAFNMLAFQEMKGGLSICVTFNDDQKKFPSPQTLYEFEHSVALRVLHRALAALVGHKKAAAALKSNYSSATRKRLDSLDDDPLTASLIAARELIGAPPKTMIFLAVDELRNVKIPHTPASDLMSNLCSTYDADPLLYLCVSAYGAIDVPNLSTGSKRKVYLQPLPPIFPVTPLHPKYVRRLPVILQVFANRGLRAKLRAAQVRDAASDNETLRKDAARDTETHKMLSTLFVKSAGHPRRVERLLLELSKHDGRLLGAPNDDPCAWNLDPNAFNVDRFRTYLRTEAYSTIGTMHKDFDTDELFPEDLNTFIPYEKLPAEEQNRNQQSHNQQSHNQQTRNQQNRNQQKRNPDLEQLARDAACKFVFPKDSNGAEIHKSTLEGTVSGHCAFIPQPQKQQQQVTSSSNFGHAFISYPVLLLICAGKSTPAAHEVLTRTLVMLGNALKSYIEGPPAGAKKDGKPFEAVALAALLLFARANEAFSITDICRHSGKDCEPVLLGGTEIALWEDVKLFPTDKRKSLNNGKYDLRMLVDRLLKSEANGAVFQPTDERNPCGDIYGLFRVNDREAFSEKPNLVLLVMQCKDWFEPERKSPEQMEHIQVIDAWRKLRKDVHREGGRYPFVHKRKYGKYPTKSKDSDSTKTSQDVTVYDLGNATVRVVHVLFTSNRYEGTVEVKTGSDQTQSSKQLKLEANEGILDMESMRTWLPTAAYSTQLIHSMRQLFLDYDVDANSASPSGSVANEPGV